MQTSTSTVRAFPGFSARFRGPVAIPGDATDLENLLAEAGASFMAWNPRGHFAPAGAGHGSLPPFLRFLDPECEPVASSEPVILPPSAPQITRMHAILGWIELIPLDRARPGHGELHSRHGGAMLRRVVFLRAMVNPRNQKHVYSWRDLGDRLHCNHEAARRWHGQGIGRILAALHGSHAAAGRVIGSAGLSGHRGAMVRAA